MDAIGIRMDKFAKLMQGCLWR